MLSFKTSVNARIEQLEKRELGLPAPLKPRLMDPADDLVDLGAVRRGVTCVLAGARLGVRRWRVVSWFVLASTINEVDDGGVRFCAEDDC